jgi:hypothetical protein
MSFVVIVGMSRSDQFPPPGGSFWGNSITPRAAGMLADMLRTNTSITRLM